MKGLKGLDDFSGTGFVALCDFECLELWKESGESQRELEGV